MAVRMTVRRAILSVSDKRGLVEFARGLAGLGVSLLASGGTAKALKDAGLSVQEISDYTNSPEMLDGRVKTLHPKIHGGLLGLRDNPDHMSAMAAHGIEPIDLVAVNLYPFEQTIARPGVSLEDAIENIDIGGPSLLRSASKNHRSVVVLVDPGDYPRVLDEMRRGDGEVGEATRSALAAKAFAHTSRYDGLIAGYLGRLGAGAEDSQSPFPDSFTAGLPKAADLRYGENPHQRAALYGDFLRFVEPLHGKELSFNNVVDANAAVELIAEFSSPTVAILKHTNPCGVGSGSSLVDAWRKAFETDTQSPFGGIIVVNRPLDLAAAKAMDEVFTELIIAPEFEDGVLELLFKKKNRRILRMGAGIEESAGGVAAMDWKRVAGGVLVQDRDRAREERDGWKVVSKRAPAEEEAEAMLFAWRVAKHVKSNAIVYSKSDRTLGIGAGQMSRIDSAEIAVSKAAKAGLSLRGCAVASDAFFPFRDSVDTMAKVGAASVIQPG
ncbi:MAG: bifunctional phosphoribosylaminoimidazolecarboxamide formyltransferase/IMP cyclohydrolase, partial [Deltaproteobacteria bacterium]|nr:bifunctional phosphoribosylaminoimidazolecarboxamide formyltransferase/IMP cyclohydrolase [Deltaproteobacteria bacterium]